MVTGSPGQHGGRVEGAGGEVVSELVAVVGKVPDLEHEADEEEGEEHHARAHQAHVEVELEVGLLVLGPGEGDVGEEARDALVHHIRLEAEGEEAVPEAPQAVTVHRALLGGRGRPHGHRRPGPDMA